METLQAREVGLPELPPLHSYVTFRPTLKHLHKQRQETAALRDLFHSLAHKRHQRGQQDIPARSVPKQDTGVKTTKRTSENQSSIDTTPKPVHDLPRIHAAGHEAAETGKKPTNKGVSRVLPNISPPQDTKRKAQRLFRSTGSASSPLKPGPQQPVTTWGSLRHSDVTSPLPYHTAITQRPVRTRSPSFRALTQFCQNPLPQWKEGKRARSFTSLSSSKRDLKEWQNEIVKVVPSRPGFVQSLSDAESTNTQTDRYPYKVLSWHPACHFYRSWSKVKDKEYVISPEWSSEKRLRQLRSDMTLRTKTELSLPRIENA